MMLKTLSAKKQCGGRCKMNYNKDCLSKNVWRKKGWHIDALILTTFSPFGGNMLNNLANELASKENDGSVFSRVFLIGCNPHYRKELANNNILGRRIFCPNCGITCKACVHVNGSRKPQKYYHPKVWCIRFKSNSDKSNSGEDVKWRIVVSSRNLSDAGQTFLDGYFVTEGTIGSALKGSHLCNLLAKVRLPKSENAEYSKLLGEISRLEFTDKFNFYQNRTLLGMLKNADKLYVLSPFANGGFIKDIDEKCNIEVFGPLNEMEYLRYECSNQSVKIYSRNVSTNPDETDKLAMSLHAKQYITEKDGKYRLYIGSHNATANAFANNTEFSVGFDIECNEAKDIIKYWTVLYPTPIKSGQPRQTQSISEHFSAAFDENSPFDNTITENEGSNYLNDLREKSFEKACEMLCKKVFGEASEGDFDKLLRTADPLPDADIDNAITETEDELPAVRYSEDWQDYTESCKKAYNIIKG